jgi:hypothetical protein
MKTIKTYESDDWKIEHEDEIDDPNFNDDEFNVGDEIFHFGSYFGNVTDIDEDGDIQITLRDNRSVYLTSKQMKMLNLKHK